MIMSHARRFVFFPDPLDGSIAISRGLQPLADQPILPLGERGGNSHFTMGMSPSEVEWAFDAMGFAFQSYMRIAVVENPYVRMVRLYNKIAETDPLWIARESAGLGRRNFGAWLGGTQPDGYGAGGRHSPRWRRFAAWSARNWCGKQVNYTIRQESIEDDLTRVLSVLGVAPGFGSDFSRPPVVKNWRQHYDSHSAALIAERYAWDLAEYGYAPLYRRKTG